MTVKQFRFYYDLYGKTEAFGETEGFRKLQNWNPVQIRVEPQFLINFIKI